MDDPSKLIKRLKNRERLNDDEIEFLVKAVSPAARGAPVKAECYDSSAQKVKVLTTYYWLNSYAKAAAATKVSETTIQRYRKEEQDGKLHPAALVALKINRNIISDFDREDARKVLAPWLPN